MIRTAVALAAFALTGAAPEQGARAVDAAALYAGTCAGCHGATLQGGGQGPALVGPAFVANWSDMPARRLYARVISTMPANDPGSLDPDKALALTLLVLRANGVTAAPVTSPDGLNDVLIH